MAHNTMNPVRTCKEKQCIKYCENGTWINATVKYHIKDHNKTEIELRGPDWKRHDVILVSSDLIVDDCTAPIFAT